MNPIPRKLRKELHSDPYYKKCALTGWDEKIVWHHPYCYGKKQINEKWNIVPVAWLLHDKEGIKESIHNNGVYKEKAKWIAINRADIHDLCIRYPKKNWIQEKIRLNEKFGEYDG